MCLYFSQQESNGGGSREAMALLPPLQSHGLSDHTGLIWEMDPCLALVPCHPHPGTPIPVPVLPEVTNAPMDLPEPGASRSKCHRQKVCLPPLVSYSCCDTTLNKMDQGPAVHPAAESELHNI